MVMVGAFLLLSGTASAATITVDTAIDEENGRTSNGAGESYPLSQGCSLREALAELFFNDGVAYDGCAAADINGPNTINLSVAGPFVVNSLVPDPADITGVNTVRNGALPMIKFDSGLIIVDGSAGAAIVSCDASPNGAKIFVAQPGSALTLTALTVSNCTASGGGIAITSDNADITINTVTFTNVHSESGGAGGVINHAGGTLNMNVVNFLLNGTADDSNPGAETGDGGAIYLGTVSLPDIVNLDTVTFTGNTAANNGGAIYWVNSDSLGHSVTISSAIFTGNSADGSDSEDGGGAIWIQTDSDITDVFLIGNSQFIGNTADNGNGGAIVISSGQLAFVDPLFPLLGGVVGTNFVNNSAGGTATVNAVGGSGGAIFVHGHLTVVQSSFITNSSTNGSGGAIALHNQSSTDAGLTVVNSTFSGNIADQAGGAIANLHVNGAMDLRNVTISGNTATGNITAGNTAAGGGAIFNINNNTNVLFPRVIVANTILANSPLGGNCVGAVLPPVFVDNGNNVQFSPNTGCELTVPSFDPMLGAPAIQVLAANSAPALNPFVLSMVPNSLSQVLNGGNNTVCSTGPVLSFDETGVPALRPYGDPNCDIGAYEGGAQTPVTLQSFSAD
jgi:predicted outer membrane repeat protein